MTLAFLRPILVFVFCLLFMTVAPAAAVGDEEPQKASAATPLPNAHAHNDYVHARPLLDALDNGFCSVEADIHLVDGALLVAHDLKDVKPGRTLEALYLDPLRQRAKINGGRIYANGPVSLTLLVDVKTEAAPSYEALQGVLACYKDILTDWRADGTTTPRAVTIVLSGARPPLATLTKEPLRYAAYDGRLSDLDKGVSPDVMPLVSESWSLISSWRGGADAALPTEDQTRIAALIAKAHQQGYRVRFWATPDTPAAWRVLRDLHVDLINTDDLAGLRQLLLSPRDARHDNAPAPHNVPARPVLP